MKILGGWYKGYNFYPTVSELGQTCMLTVTQDKKEICEPWTHGYSARLCRMQRESKIMLYRISQQSEEVLHIYINGNLNWNIITPIVWYIYKR